MFFSPGFRILEIYCTMFVCHPLGFQGYTLFMSKSQAFLDCKAEHSARPINCLELWQVKSLSSKKGSELLRVSDLSGLSRRPQDDNYPPQSRALPTELRSLMFPRKRSIQRDGDDAK